MSNKTLNLDISKEPKINPIIYGRVGDGDSQRITVNTSKRDEQLDLTGYTITFEGVTSGGKTKVFDSDNVVVTSEGLKKGTFDYVFPNMAFAVKGKYERAYFSFIKDGIRDTSGEIEIIVLDNADIDAAEAETIITEYNKLVTELRKLQDQAIADMNQNFAATQAKISELEKQLSDTQSELQQALKDFENGNFWTKEESFNKEESSANVIYQIIGKEKVQLTFAMDYKGKQSGSVAENVNVARLNAITALPSPESFGGNELSNAQYELIGSLDNRNFVTTQPIQGRLSGNLYLFNMVAHIENKLGDTFFSSLGAQTILQKARLLKDMFVSIESSNYGYGSSPSGYKMNTFRATNDLNGVFNSWILASNHANGTITKGSAKLVSQGQFDTALDKNGNFAMAVTAEASDGAVSSTLNVDYAILEFTIELSMNQFIKSMIAANHVQNLATQEEAEAGTDNTKLMTPFGTRQQIDKRVATQSEVEAGTNNTKLMTPYSTNTSVFKNYGQPFTAATKFVAHRGNNYFYPENSIVAFEKTTRHWGAETDIQLTTDGKWYCFHDKTVDRMTNGTGNFMDKTSSEIEALRLDTGNGINTLSDVEKKIPTFEQYLNACIKARIVPVIEITPLKTDFTDAQLDSIVTVIRRKGLLNKCVIICFTYEVLVKMRQRMPYTVMHWLISEYSDEMIQKCVINNFVPSFDYSKASVNQALIDKIHDAGLECGLWTVPYSDHQKYTDMGVDNITTDSASGNLRYFEPALRSGMLPNKVNLIGPTYIEETSNGEIHIRVNVTGGQNDVGVYICALESWAIPRHSLTLIGYVRSTKVTGFSFVPVAVGVGGYSANDSTIADANIKFGYLTTGTNWEQRDTYAAFDIFYRI